MSVSMSVAVPMRLAAPRLAARASGAKLPAAVPARASKVARVAARAELKTEAVRLVAGSTRPRRPEGAAWR